MARTVEQQQKLSVAQLAQRERLSYQSAYNRALRGDFGRLEREGPRLYVLVPAHAPSEDPPAA